MEERNTVEGKICLMGFGDRHFLHPARFVRAVSRC